MHTVLNFTPADTLAPTEHRLNSHFYSSHILFCLKSHKEVVILRQYISPDMATACVWIENGASGRARGSAGATRDADNNCVRDAFEAAGFVFGENGTGDAFSLAESVADFFGITHYHVFHAHG